ncbi:MAG: hypothetical protein R6V35_03175 [Candidatus Nanohaloarchaea archaeon]
MDLYNIVTKIPYLMMLGIGLVIVLQIFVGGLNDLSVRVDNVPSEEYNKSLATEGILNLGQRRGIVPIEYFTEEGEDPGFRADGATCYFDGINRLDGENLAFRISSEQLEPDEGGVCQGVIPPNQAYHTRILLKNGSEMVPAMVSVYEP